MVVSKDGRDKTILDPLDRGCGASGNRLGGLAVPDGVYPNVFIIVLNCNSCPEDDEQVPCYIPTEDSGELAFGAFSTHRMRQENAMRKSRDSGRLGDRKKRLRLPPQ